jgi:hypothetical protein
MREECKKGSNEEKINKWRKKITERKMMRNEIRLAGLEVLIVTIMNSSLLLGYNAVKFVESSDVSEEHVTPIFTVED